VGPTGRVVGADINPYLLREASAIAGHQLLRDVIAFEVGSAEALPFPDGRFDAALACTVLDEADADRGLAELARVVRPGGRVAVLVRAVDIPAWDSLPLRPELRAKLTARPKRGSRPEGAPTPASIADSRPQASPLWRWGRALPSTSPKTAWPSGKATAKDYRWAYGRWC
jgi:SAM-dependent methyltransferase